MADLQAGTATAELVIDASDIEGQLNATFAQIGKLVSAQEKKIAESSGFEALGKQIEQFARATAQAESQIRSLRFDAIATEVGQLTSALKGAESGIQVTEDLAKAESLLEERFALVRAEIQRQAEAQRGLVDEEVLLQRTTLQLEAAQRQHDQALATVRGRALQAAEGIAQLEQEEQASAIAAQQSWEAVGKLAIEQQKAEQSARELAAQEAKLAADAERSAAQAKANKEAWEGAKTAYGLVSKAVVAVGTALLATEAAAVALTVKTVEQGDELNRLSDQYGVAVTTLAGMKQAFKDNELEAGDLNTALRQFSNVLGEAMAGGEKATATVEALGISTAKLKDGTLSTEDAFRIAIDSLSKMENGYGKASISQDLFGRAGSKIPGIFKDGAKSIDAASAAAMAMGNSFTEVEQQAVAKLDDAMDELSDRVAGLGASIGKELMPVAADIVREANEWIKANRELIQQDVKSFALGIRDAMKDLLPLVQHVAEALGFVGDVIAGISGPAAQSFAALREEEARLVEETKGAEEVFRLFHPLTKELGDSADYAGQRYKSLQAQLAVVREKIAATLDPTKKARATLADLQKVTEDEADAANRAGEANDKLPPPIIKTGDAAKKAAKEFAELANKLASTSAASADYATEQISLAGETGDLTAIEETHKDAIVAVEKAYQDGLAAIEANKAAGEDQKLLDTELVKLEQDKEAALRKVAKTTAAATAVTKQYAIELEQVKLDQLALEADQAAREMEKLVRAGAANIVIQRAAAKAAEKEKAVRDQQVKIIEMQEGAQKDANKQTIIAAGATNAAAKATDEYNQKLDDLADKLRAAKLEDPLGKLDRNLGKSTEDITLKLDELLHGDKGFGQFVEDLKSTLLGSNGPGAIIDAMGAAAEHGLRDLLKTTVNFGTDITKSLVNDVTEPITKGLQHLEGEIVKGIENLAEDAWDAITDLFGGGKSRAQQLAEQMGKAIGGSFTNDAVKRAVIAGAEAIGDYAGESLVHAMAKMPVSELHKGIHDVVTEAFAGESAAVQTEIQQLAQAAGTAVAASLNYVGGEAIAFSQAWAASWIRAQVQAGKSAEQIIKALEAMDKSLGTSGGIFAALDALNAKILETGKSGEVFKDLNAIIKDWTGKKADVQSFSDVLAAFGGDAVLTLNAIKKSMEDNGIAVEQFGDDLGDVVLAFTGAGESIQEATDDYRKFGNEADGTADILRQKVLSGLDDVIASAKDFPVESVQAFTSAVAMIPPEMLASSEFVNALREDFARMAVESHMSVQELVDSIDPPLPEATRNAILAVNDLGKAIGDLTGAPLKSLKEVTDRMKQFGSEMYREVKDAEGNVTRELTAFGQELIDEASTAISGMWSQMNEDGWVGLDEIGVMFDQLALLPIEALNDPAIQQATRDLLAKIGAMTGDAAIIAMANAETITQDMIAQGLAAYDEYKKTVEENPPEVPPPTTPDGQPTTGPDGQPTGPDTTPASTAPPPAPIPPETLKSWEEINAAATAYATAVLAGRDAVEALAATTTTSAAAMLAAIRPIYGEPTDDGSLASIERIFHDLKEFLDGDGTQSFKDFGIAGSEAVSSIFTAAGNATSAMHSLTDSEWVVKVRYEVTGAPPPTPTPGTLPKSHSGELIPGTPGTESLRIVEAGEWIWPAGLTEKLLSGSALALPASMASRVNRAAAVPAVRGGGMGGARGASSRDSDAGLVSVRMSRQDAADALVAPIFVRLEDENGAGRVHFRDAKGRPVKMSVDAHVRGKARAR